MMYEVVAGNGKYPGEKVGKFSTKASAIEHVKRYLKHYRETCTWLDEPNDQTRPEEQDYVKKNWPDDEMIEYWFSFTNYVPVWTVWLWHYGIAIFPVKSEKFHR